MQLIIDIDKQIFDKLTEYGEPLSAGNGFHDSILKAVANGIPLPKGHGDLIDRNVAYTEFENAGCSYEGNILRFVPVVIKADK